MNVTMTDSVTAIGDMAFLNCGSLATVYYAGSEAQRDAAYVGNANEVPERVTVFYEEEDSVLLGDVTFDGSINRMDALTLYAVVSGAA